NVKELLRGRHKHHYQNLHRSLTKLGYNVFAEVHDLKDFGLPQSRKRSLIVAKLDGAFSLSFPRVNRFNTVRDAIGHLPPIEAGETHADDPMHAAPKMNGLSMERMKAIPKDGGSWIDLMESNSHLAIPSMDPLKPGSYPDIYGRLSWDKPAPTVTRECCHPGNGRYSHPEQDRLLSVREMSLLQGFFPDYSFMGSLASKYRQIGDAVPPMIAQKIARAIWDDSKGIETHSNHEMQLDLAG
ncbi:MAG: DNA cytosine methyltransferase, partial [Tateyamaria sp.]